MASLAGDDDVAVPVVEGAPHRLYGQSFDALCVGLKSIARSLNDLELDQSSGEQQKKSEDDGEKNIPPSDKVGVRAGRN